MGNMMIYDKARSVPDEAKKPITAGRLKGMTDVNPMYRIKRLTEMFGPCGIGWWYEITKREIVDDEMTHQRAAFVDILLYYKDPETGDISLGIPGTGGASFVSQERNGPYLSDECFKMALTDALSVACKALGIAADVYWDKDRTKYSSYENAEDKPQTPEERRAEIAKAVKDVKTCERCGKPIRGGQLADGTFVKAEQIMEQGLKDFKMCLCYHCQTALKQKKEAAS